MGKRGERVEDDRKPTTWAAAYLWVINRAFVEDDYNVNDRQKTFHPVTLGFDLF